MKKRFYIFRAWFLSRRRLIEEIRAQMNRADKLEAEPLKQRKWRYTGRSVVMPLDMIRIPSYMSPPRTDNLNACAEFYRDHGVIDRAIVVNRNGWLLDGYIGYLVLKAHDVAEWKVLKVVVK